MENIKGSLLLRAPLLKDFWDYENNSEDIDNLSYYSKNPAYWKCPKCGLSWEEEINFISKRSNPCPNCSKVAKLIQGVNDLATLRPDLLKDWDWNNNYKLPEELTLGARYRASWVCHVCGHSWESRLDSRTKNMHGCPMCAKGGGSSVPDYTLYKLLSLSLNCEVLYRFNVLPRLEADVYIPSKKVVIEYNGYGFHKSKDKQEKDRIKEDEFISAGLKVFKFVERKDRYKNIEIFSDYALIPEMSMDSFEFLKETLIKCCIEWGILNYADIPNSFFELNLSDIRANVSKPIYKRSMAYLLDSRDDLNWDFELNEGIKPEDVYRSIRTPIYLKCDKGHSFLTTPRHVNDGYGCKICYGRGNSDFNKFDLAYNMSLLFKKFKESKDSIDTLKKITVSCNCPFCGLDIEYKVHHLFDTNYNAEFCPCTKELVANVIILGVCNQSIFYCMSILERYFLVVSDGVNDIVLKRLGLEKSSCHDLNVNLFRKYLTDPYIMNSRYNSSSTVPVNCKKINLNLIPYNDKEIENCYISLKKQITGGIEITNRNENIYILDSMYIINSMKDRLEKRFGVNFALNRTVGTVNTSLACNKLSMYLVVRVHMLKNSAIANYENLYINRSSIKRMFFLSNMQDLVDNNNGFFYVKENVFESELQSIIDKIYKDFLNFYGYTE